MRPDWGYYGTYDESAHPDLWDGVVGYWAPCLGPTGLRLHDLSRYNNWGTLTGMDAAADWVVQDGQYAINFSASDFINIGTNRLVNALRNELTATAWIRPLGTQAADYSPISQFFNSSSPWMIYIAPTVIAYINGGVRASGTTTVSTSGVWQHVAMTLRGGVAAAYYNGRAEATGNVTGTITLNNGDLQIGSYNGGQTLDRSIRGMVDDVVIWNRGLTPTEMWRLYQLGRGGMLERRRRRRVYAEQVGFRAHYRSQRAQLIGGGLR
jgi:hypothetical protein